MTLLMGKEPSGSYRDHLEQNKLGRVASGSWREIKL